MSFDGPNDPTRPARGTASAGFEAPPKGGPSIPMEGSAMLRSLALRVQRLKRDAEPHAFRMEREAIRAELMRVAGRLEGNEISRRLGEIRRLLRRMDRPALAEQRAVVWRIHLALGDLRPLRDNILDALERAHEDMEREAEDAERVLLEVGGCSNSNPDV